MILFSWNIRGLGRPENRKVVRNLVMSLKPQLLFIQESKLNKFDSRVIKSLGGSILTSGMGVEATGSAGGLITLRNEELFTVKTCISNDRSIILSRELVRLRKDVVFCNVYATNRECERKEL
ncbi:hypothetical protein Dsin_025295 [Dipteronia sinensis]|uniref:Endonuclease/exonuclease/phosphatase domain-containing protein n=1 Tax=Dipteronia sinensis TaxID=43782 RepID=A0AAD9ZVC9_9ROSI|nr:hypothetical protein Dsin_025295 [Dipteronia sinensis]